MSKIIFSFKSQLSEIKEQVIDEVEYEYWLEQIRTSRTILKHKIEYDDRGRITKFMSPTAHGEFKYEG